MPRDAGLSDFAFAAATTRGQARSALARELRDRGVDAPEREAGLVLLAAAGLRAVELIGAPEAPLGAAASKVAAFAARRAAGEPLSRILGRREFWSLDFRLSPDVLDPRADSETLVAAALSAVSERRDEALRILDLGVGSGALLCALLKELPSATGVGVDVSPRAAAVALGNIERLGLATRATVRVGDWGAGLDGAFDLIVANPPYIRSAEIAGLDREVRDHDPRAALDGGEDGLDAYRALAPDVATLLHRSGGMVFLEVGEGQAGDVAAILRGNRFAEIRLFDDLSGRIRVVGCQVSAAL